MRRRRHCLVALALLALALGGCRGEPEPADDVAPGDARPSTPLLAPDGHDDPAPASSTLRWAIGPPDEIIPPLATTRDGLRVVDAVFESLTRLDADLEPIPGAAVGWRSSPDARAWTFTLRPGATFHDGSPVRSSDVKYAWEEAIRRGRVPPYLADVRGYDALESGEADELAGVLARGQRTVQVLLDRPRADLPVVLAHPSLAPIPRHQYERDPDGFAEEPVGNGAYRADEGWVRGRFIRLSVADGPAGGRATVDEVLFRIVDPATGYIAFQQGRVDIATVPDGALDDAVERFGESADGRTGPGVLRGQSGELVMLAMDVSAPPFDQVPVRRALSFAVDRARLIDEVVPDGNAEAARGAAPSRLPGSQASACSTCLHAPDAAARIFSEQGVDALTVWLDSDGGRAEALGERLQEDFAAVGVELAVEQRPLGEVLDAVDEGQATLFRYGWVADHPTAEDMLVPLLSSASAGVATGNPGGYESPEVDALLGEALATTDVEERHALLQAAETIAVGREQAIIPLLVPQHRLVVDERVGEFRLEPTGRADLTRVRIDGDAGQE